jgi:hypothetical protein
LPASAANCAKNWWAKTILLSQTGMFWLFFIQIYCAESRTEHCWGRSYVLLLKGQSHYGTIRFLLFHRFKFQMFSSSCALGFMWGRIFYEPSALWVLSRTFFHVPAF